MKNNTYDIKSIQFYVDRSYSYTGDDWCKHTVIEKWDYNLFSGLSISLIDKQDKFLRDGYIVVFACTNIPRKNEEGKSVNNIANEANIKEVKMYQIKIDSYDKDLLLDDVVASIMIKEYDSYNESEKRIVRCFLERYIFEDKKETDDYLRKFGIEPSDNHVELDKLLQKKPRETDN